MKEAGFRAHEARICGECSIEQRAGADDGRARAIRWRLRPASLILAAAVLATVLLATPATAAETSDGASWLIQYFSERAHAHQLSTGSVSGQGEARSPEPVGDLSEAEIVERLASAHLTPEQAVALWEFFADEDHADLATLPIIGALVAATDTPRSRQALWSELAGLARAKRPGRSARTQGRSLLDLFERHSVVLMGRMSELQETTASADDMIELMLSTKVFGSDLEDSVARASERIPAAVARHIERKRELGAPVRWEYTAFESMARWKNAHLLPNGVKAPRTLAALDDAGETFIVVFNCLHTLNIGFREVMMRGLGPAEIYNAVVAGEKELYRLGTSGYRTWLHNAIMRGIAEAGSFEAFAERAAPRRLGIEERDAIGRRSMVFLRVVSSFGLLEPVLATVRDRRRFIDDAIASVGNPDWFEENSSVLMDVLTAGSTSPLAFAFRKELLERLYMHYERSRNSPGLRNVYGSMLSAYQTITNDRRDPSIDLAFPLDQAAFQIPFEKLFSDDGRGGHIHRMFMRLDEGVDDSETYARFQALMGSLGASVRDEQYFAVFKIAAYDRTVEIYANKPSTHGLRHGIDDIEDALAGARVETVIGRGHTNIIEPLQKDSRRLLGDRIRRVAVVFVGSCGGDASVREMIRTYGYVPFLTTKSTGRQVINNAIIKAYLAALAALQPGQRLAITDVLAQAITRFVQSSDEELRNDAKLYHVNRAAVLSALLFDAHIRPHFTAIREAALESRGGLERIRNELSPAHLPWDAPRASDWTARFRRQQMASPIP